MLVNHEDRMVAKAAGSQGGGESGAAGVLRDFSCEAEKCGFGSSSLACGLPRGGTGDRGGL